MTRLANLGLIVGAMLGVALCIAFVFLPLSLTGQAMAAAVTLVLLFLVTRSRSQPMKFALATLAVVTSTRYMYWRLTSTMTYDSVLEAGLGIGMFVAEAFLWFILVSNFIQNLWPQQRRSAPLPDDPRQWPSVDVYITTYNEPLEVVAPTILAARALDYPADKLNVYVLDDGRRDEFRRYAESAGVGYITRGDNRHAKAGNLNNALAHSSGELVAVFDCDHVPTRGFLQQTVGWFLRDPKMAVVQTPHHFYNHDPVERNLVVGREIPNEGLLFYGLTQDGNDFWNAAYFCGSCAVLRRSALADVGGFAVETVTEDAHTSLRLHRAGWNSAYLRQPLAAGLATESVADHIGQRARWARGMTQILRLENPLFGTGLSLLQRLCYLNSMLHFLFPLPRIVLLTAPLAYLLFDQHIISASAYELLAYAGPHLAVALVASVIVMGRYRYVFWAEIYETLLSFHLVLPTLVTLFSPFRGRFNVTKKGIPQRGEHFHWRALRGLLAATALLLFGVALGTFRLTTGQLEETEVPTMMINLVWAFISLGFIGVALAIGREAAEFRRSPRIPVTLPVCVQLPSGHSYSATTRDISLGGASIALARPAQWEAGPVAVELPCGSGHAVVEADVQGWDAAVLRVSWSASDVRVASDLVRTILGRHDAWSAWDRTRPGSFGHSVGAIFRSIWHFLGYVARSLTPRRKVAS